LLAVFLKQVDQQVEFLQLLLGSGILHPARLPQIFLQRLVAELRALAVRGGEGIESALELRAALAYGECDVAVLMYHQVLAHPDVGVHLVPQLGDITVCDHDAHQAGVGHFQHVLGFKIAWRFAQSDRRHAALSEALIERQQVLVVAGGAAHVHLLAGKIVQRCQRRRPRTGDDQLLHIAGGGGGEIHDRAALRRDREIGGGDVAFSGQQQWQQVRARYRNEHHVYAQIAVPEPGVEIVLERTHEVIAHAALRAAQVDEIQGAAVGHQYPDVAPRDHAVQIAGPGLLL
jgi:hypothetical protein